MTEQIFLIGCGRLGRAMALALSETVHRIIGCFDLDTAAAEALSACLSGCLPVEAIDQAPTDTTLVLVAVPDAAIEGIGQALSQSVLCRPACLWVHTSGLWPAEKLGRGGVVLRGSLHPAMLYPAGGEVRFSGVPMAVEGDALALPRLMALARALHADPMEIPAAQKTLYHAACVMASNLLVGLLAATTDVATLIRPEAGLQWLFPIIRATLDEVEKKGAAATLTGPVKRGDVETVTSHLAALSKTAPEMLPLYRVLSSVLVQLAQEEGLLENRAEALQTLLQEPASH